MPKGKKFDAAQKHFEEKEQRLHREVAHERANTEKYLVNTLQRIEFLEKENKRLSEESALIRAKYEKILEKSNLADEDVQALVRGSKAFCDLSEIMGCLRI